MSQEIPNEHPIARVVAAVVIGGTNLAAVACDKPTEEPVVPATPIVVTGGEVLPSQRAYEQVRTITPDEFQALATATSTVAPATSPVTEPTKASTATPETAKPLPDVINSQTVKFTTPPTAEIQRLIDEAQTKGQSQIPMPGIIQNPKFSLIEEPEVSLDRSLVITGNELNGNYHLHSLTEGKVGQVMVGQSGSFSAIGVRTKDGFLWGYIFPSPGSTKFKEGDDIKIGDVIASFTYDSDDLNTKNFVNAIKTQTKAPPNTLFLIAGETGTKGLNRNNILASPQGIVTVSGK